MAPIMSSVEIARPADEVFAYATDPVTFSEWQNDVEGARYEPGKPPGVGARFTTRRRVGPTVRTMTQEITEYHRPTRWAVRGVDGPVRSDVAVTVEPLADGTRSRVTVVMDLRGSGIGRLLVPLFVRRVAARRAPGSYRLLKERLEGDA